MGDRLIQREIQILFAEQKQTAKADAKGYWEVNLKALEAGGPYQLQITGKRQPNKYQGYSYRRCMVM